MKIRLKIKTYNVTLIGDCKNICKIDKYEYLTDKEILPSNKQQMIEQAKFTNSPLGKAFEKETKTIEDQGENQITPIQNKRPIKSIEKIAYNNNDSPMVLKEKELYNKLTDESREKINKLNNKVDTNKLVFNIRAILLMQILAILIIFMFS